MALIEVIRGISSKNRMNKMFLSLLEITINIIDHISYDKKRIE